MARNEKIVLEKSDILVADALVVYDLSSVILNLSKKDNFIHANEKEVVVGTNCSIIGRGLKGLDGSPGEKGITARIIAEDLPGANAVDGVTGQNATSISFYL